MGTEAADPEASALGINREFVERTEGRRLSDKEFAEIVSQQCGSRSMGQEKRELFSCKELLNWDLQAVTRRGLVCSPDEPAARVLKDPHVTRASANLMALFWGVPRRSQILMNFNGVDETARGQNAARPVVAEYRSRARGRL